MTAQRKKQSQKESSIDDVVINVCKTTDMSDNEMKTFKLGRDGDILLIKQKEVFWALGTKCPHYGGPLEKGALTDGKLRCPWHSACFNIQTGDLEDFPGVDSLPCYKVNIKDGFVEVHAKKSLLASNRREKGYTVWQDDVSKRIVIVGGGAAGMTCAATLRECGFKGHITLIAGEPYLPYERVRLSKVLGITANDVIFKNEEFYKKRQIELILNTKVEKLITREHKLLLSQGETIGYDKVFFATGSRPRRMSCPGSELKNIFHICTIDDNWSLFNSLTRDSEVTILGSSFIGVEVAAAVFSYVKTVTVISVDSAPFEYVFGIEIGNRIMRMYQEKGVKFLMNQSILEFRGKSGVLSSVVLLNSVEVRATVCVVAIGSVANSLYMDNVMPLEKNRTIEVDEYMQTSIPNVYAGGDVAYANLCGSKENFRHIQLAHYHGKVAALNMAGIKTKLNAVPFFWFTAFGKTFRFCGYAPKYEHLEIRGDLDTPKFAGFYILEEGVVGAVVTYAMDPVAGHFGHLVESGGVLHLSEIDAWLANIVSRSLSQSE